MKFNKGAIYMNYIKGNLSYIVHLECNSEELLGDLTVPVVRVKFN